MYIPTGHKEPRRDLVSWNDEIECTGSAIMDVDVYRKESEDVKSIFLCQNKNLYNFVFVIFVVFICLIIVSFVDLR